MLIFKLRHLIAKIALFAIVFATVSPTISYALEKQTFSTYSQEICSANGKKIIIQILTFDDEKITSIVDKSKSENSNPISLQHHFQQCPFCSNSSTNAVIQQPHAFFVTQLIVTSDKILSYIHTFTQPFYTVPPPSQAPPPF